MAELRRTSRVPDSAAGIPKAPASVDLRLDGNQGRLPPAGFFARLADDRELLRSYPLERSLEPALAARHGVADDRIFVAAGGDDVLDRLCRAVLEPGRTAIVPVPTFEMLERHIALSGAELHTVPWTEGAWPRAAVLAACGEATGLVAIVSPNNPTGLVATAEDVRAVSAAVPRAVVLLDAAYAELGGEDLTAVALSCPNVVVLRTFSKAFGLAGLRVGYVIAPPAVVQWLRAIGGAFPCGTLSRRAALLRLGDERGDVADYVARVAVERQQLGERLQHYGFATLPSAANFVFARGPHCEWLRDALLGLGIAVRCIAGGVRITVPGAVVPFERLLRGIDAAMAPAAMLFDLDGVLADIEGRHALADPAVLQAIAAARPIGVVTSCPRRLAESVLARHGLLQHVRVLVADEDAPPKPDPAPVKLCLQRLGVTAAWLLGDNPGDLEAARGAGVVPLAIAPRGIGAESHAARLRDAGAGRFVEGLPQLATLLTGLPSPV